MEVPECKNVQQQSGGGAQDKEYRRVIDRQRSGGKIKAKKYAGLLPMPALLHFLYALHDSWS